MGISVNYCLFAYIARVVVYRKYNPGIRYPMNIQPIGGVDSGGSETIYGVIWGGWSRDLAVCAMFIA